jgi:hypothetical protein
MEKYNKKGISMISLVIIIVVTIILLGIAVTAGYRYIEASKNARAQAICLTVGSAAKRRQDDLSTGVAQRYYDGYVFRVDDEISKYTLIEGIPSGDVSGDGIPDVLQDEDSIWYIFDVESANNLGVRGTEEFLTRNVKGIGGNPDEETTAKVVLADYITGKAYYVTAPVEVLGHAINFSDDCQESVDGKHKFTVATCTEGSQCIYCGRVERGPLGHKWADATCTADGYCERCGIHNQTDPAKGHMFIPNTIVDSTSEDAKKIRDMINGRGELLYKNTADESRAWVADANKHWHECLRCGLKFETDNHQVDGFVSITDTHHQQGCTICGWESIKAAHSFGPPVILTENTHKVVCTGCLKEVIHSEQSTTNPHTDTATAWYSNSETFHYRICNENDDCNRIKVIIDNGSQVDVAFKEEHKDNDHDYYCDDCGRAVDRTPPKEFNNDDYNTYARQKGATTSSVTLEAFTVDNELGIDYYQFGKVRKTDQNTEVIDWETTQVRPSSANSPVEYVFSNLNASGDYVFYVRAFDESGNSNTPARIKARTSSFPEFKGITGLPTKVVKGPIEIGIEKIETSIPDIFIQYSINGGDWSQKISLDDLENTKISLNSETVSIEFRFIDSRGNTGPAPTYTTNYIDNTPPVVTISEKDGDNPRKKASQHFARVTIADTEGSPARAGIAQGTTIKYAWSTSNTVEPTYDHTYTTTNTATAESVSFDIETPPQAKGNYYLWIQRGTEDAVGNATTSYTVSPMYFVVDDEEATITNIEMYNSSPDPKVPGEKYYVKTNGQVIVTFKTDKALKQDPVVRLNNVNMDIQSAEGSYYCRIYIDESFEEGPLQLYIGDVISDYGRASDRVYTNDDITPGKGPVIYDKTPPKVEYIPKKTD